MHCYRMLGSLQDAEDALQDALLAAWRGLRRLRGTRLGPHLAVPGRDQPLPERAPFGQPPPGHGATARARTPPEPTRLGEVTWLEPCPDALLEGLADAEPGPEARYEAREAISLAFITACSCCRRGSGPC